ncbi:hypothetical protein [uncultured Methanolobus sp.]
MRLVNYIEYIDFVENKFTMINKGYALPEKIKIKIKIKIYS